MAYPVTDLYHSPLTQWLVRTSAPLQRAIQDGAVKILDLPETKAPWETPPSAPLWLALSSGGIYGEGPRYCWDCGPMPRTARDPERLQAKRWEYACPICGDMMMPLGLKESDAPEPTTDWGRTYLAFEQFLTTEAASRQIPLVILRVFTLYWMEDSGQLSGRPGCWLSGIIKALEADQPVQLPEDGYAMRDLTHGQDLIQAVEAVIDRQWALGPHVFNIASGKAFTPLDTAISLQDRLNKTGIPLERLYTPWGTQPRYQLADIMLAHDLLSYNPVYSTQDGLRSL